MSPESSETFPRPHYLQNLPRILQTMKNTTEFSQWCSSFTVESVAFATGLRIAGTGFEPMTSGL